MMVSSEGNYMLRFSGNIDDISNDLVVNNLINDTYEKYIRRYGNEEGLLRFTKREMNVSGIVLAKIEDNGSIKTKNLDNNNNLQSTYCI